MWSLPDIVRMNEEAADAATKAKLQHDIEHPHEHSCEVCSWHGEQTPAAYGYLWFDVFSDDPKGSIFLCEEHDGYTGLPMEGFFTCAECERVMTENYTHELYYYLGDSQVCLPCALRHYLSDERHWINPNDVQQVILDPNARQKEDDADGFEWDCVFDASTGVLNLAACPHLIAVKMPVPDELHFEGNLEFDSTTGEMLASYSSTFAPGVGEAAVMERIRALAEQGYTRFVAILDAGWQFAVSIGLYTDSGEHKAVEERRNGQQPVRIAA